MLNCFPTENSDKFVLSVSHLLHRIYMNTSEKKTEKTKSLGVFPIFTWIEYFPGHCSLLMASPAVPSRFPLGSRYKRVPINSLVIRYQRADAMAEVRSFIIQNHLIQTKYTRYMPGNKFSLTWSGESGSLNLRADVCTNIPAAVEYVYICIVINSLQTAWEYVEKWGHASIEASGMRWGHRPVITTCQPTVGCVLMSLK